MNDEWLTKEEINETRAKHCARTGSGTANLETRGSSIETPNDANIANTPDVNTESPTRINPQDMLYLLMTVPLQLQVRNKERQP